MKAELRGGGVRAPGAAAARGGRARRRRRRPRLPTRAAELAEFGLVLEPFGAGRGRRARGAGAARARPRARLVRDLADDLAEWGDALALRGARSRASCGTLACHGSVRAGRRLIARGDERAAAPDGGDAVLRPVQPRPPDLCRASARGRRAAVRPARLKTAGTLAGAPICSGPAAFGAGRVPIWPSSGEIDDLRGHRSMHPVQVHGLRRGLPRGLLLRGREHAGHPPRRVHRLRRVRAGMPGGRDPARHRSRRRSAGSS